MVQRLTFDTASVVVSFTDQPAWVRGLLCANKEMASKLWKIFMDAAVESRATTTFLYKSPPRRLRDYADSEATDAYCEAIVAQVERCASPTATSADRKVGGRAAFAAGSFHGEHSLELAVRCHLFSALVSCLTLFFQRWEATAAEPVPSRSFERTVVLATSEFVMHCKQCGVAYCHTPNSDSDEIMDLLDAMQLLCEAWNGPHELKTRDEDFLYAVNGLGHLLEEDIDKDDAYWLRDLDY